jgi:microcystin-dependent protein
MALNKLENFIKSTDGRIIFVNPSDINSTDAVTNDGTSLITPFKTIQRALLEAARFSYQKGDDNDLVEKTTILLFPGEHVIDNRPGFAIYNNGGAKAVSRGGNETVASSVFSLQLNSVFDLTQEDNILYKFNSYYGGVVVPRGTSVVSLDLRKTKIRPKYVPNPTDSLVPKSSIFRITGACYFWQFSIFDADPSGIVYTNPDVFTEPYRSTPNFSHHKLTCFEFCDGVNSVGSYGLTDLDMYYAKISNAFNAYRDIDQKYPDSPLGFAKQRSEWEIVGAFAPDSISISDIISGNGSTATAVITVTTAEPHELNSGTPIKIRGVSGPGVTEPYNISTKVQSVISPTIFTYLLPGIDSYPTLNPNPSSSTATVTIETDTVSGASPYIFNCSLRSVWGMNGLHADGSKSSGFRSTVVAQFTAVSLQKDDRAFTKYDQSNREYDSVPITTVYGSNLPTGSSQTNSEKVYHLDSSAIYRKGWESSHIKVTNDAFIQIVSVFAIGFNKHFDAESGGDASITNSNSNFGQISLNSTGFKKESFDKDDNAFITSVIPPRAVISTEENIEWLSIDVQKTIDVATSNHLYLSGFTSLDSSPSALTQGYRIGARLNDKLYLTNAGLTYSSFIYMCNNEIADSGFTAAQGTTSSVKSYTVTSGPSSNSFTIGVNNLLTGEKVKIISDDGDLPENITEHETYYVINNGDNNTIKLASSFTNAKTNQPLTVYGGTNLTILSRVSDKESGELGSPIQYDPQNSNWFIHTSSEIYNAIVAGGTSVFGTATDLAYVKRISDGRSLDEKLYKFRVVIPKELPNAKDPESGFTIQESKTTGVRDATDFTLSVIDESDYKFNRNLRLIANCSVASNTVTVTCELPHDLQNGDYVNIKNVESSTNSLGTFNEGYNGTFEVSSIIDSYTFQYLTTDTDGKVHTPGTFTDTTTVRDENLPRFERSNCRSNLYIYRNEIISPYIYNQQDGIYHLYVLNASNSISTEFTNLEYSQLPVDLYPQLDRDNVDDNPKSAKTYAKRSPIGAVVTNDLKKSVTRESADLALKTFGNGLKISSVSSSTSSATITFERIHGLGGISGGTVTGGAAYTPGTYYNVKLYSDIGLSIWKGATAKVVVQSGGNISTTQTKIIASGSGYSAGSLYFDTSIIGAGSGGLFTVSSNNISNGVGNVIQFTGDGTKSDTYHRITSIDSSTQISIAKTSGDITISTSQYGFLVGPSVTISGTPSYNSTTGTTTFTTSSAHGLLKGNRFTVLNSGNNNLGNYIVKDRISYNQFTAITNASISAASGYIIKHGLSSNEAISDIREENFGTRNATFYQDNFILGTAITSTNTTTLSIANASRILIGSYLQIDNEIMRVISGNNTTSVSVIRGVLGTRAENHDANSMIREIKPIAIDFHRPSILRASGHTFEYLGYGPGNYSTGLPQVQVRTLNDQENFLANSQERSGGVVVYNGLNNNGDLFNGNTKTSSTSGEVVSYDIPKPTVTGEDPNKLSVVFDEVTIKERLLVEGGKSNRILSQFNGPVTFNKEIRAKEVTTFNKSVRITQGNDSSSPITGDLIVAGGVGIGKTLTVGGNIDVRGSSIISGELVVNTGIVPDTDEGAYLGTAAKPFSDAHIGEIRIAQTDDNTIDTATGDLKLNAASGNDVSIGNNVTINGNLDMTSGTGILSANYLAVPNITPVGSIVMWAGTLSNFPTGWAVCNGSELPISSYTTLYNVLTNNGTSFPFGTNTNGSGGSGSTHFRLPDLRERFIVSYGDSYQTGITGGSPDATLVSHSHTGFTAPSGRHTHPLLMSKYSGSFGSNDVDGGDGGFLTEGGSSEEIGSGTLGTPNTNLGEQIGGAIRGDTDVNGQHSHLVTVESEGVSPLNANLPPYMALVFLMRII